ncbi:unnamed protein product [Effrenium voratum]|nr:unnamed protein product [Effrenium voratum]
MNWYDCELDYKRLSAYSASQREQKESAALAIEDAKSPDKAKEEAEKDEEKDEDLEKTKRAAKTMLKPVKGARAKAARVIG